jgi:hypothetical protein
MLEQESTRQKIDEHKARATKRSSGDGQVFGLSEKVLVIGWTSTGLEQESARHRMDEYRA